MDNGCKQTAVTIYPPKIELHGLVFSFIPRLKVKMAVFFPNMYFFKGQVMALESLRTGQAGVVSLGLFITFGISTTAATYQRIQQLRQLVDTGWLLIAVMPAFFGFLAGPYYDYNSALL